MNRAPDRVELHLVEGAEALSRATIAATEVSKRYGSLEVLQRVSFSARPRQAIALWGANGAGKTTLIRALLGLIVFDGKIVIAGRDVAEEGKAARRSIGYVPQEAAFYDLDLRHTMIFFARLKGVDQAAVERTIDQLGLREHQNKSVAALSGGLRQRMALGLALLSDPPVLLLDEPTASLDVRVQHDYLERLEALRDAGKTIVFATHRVEEVEALADEVLVLESGRVAARLAPQELRRWS